MLTRIPKRTLEIDSWKGKHVGRSTIKPRTCRLRKRAAQTGLVTTAIGRLDESAVNVTADNTERGVVVIVAAGTQARAQYAFKGNGETIHEETIINVVTNNTTGGQDRGMEDQDHMKRVITSKRNIGVRKEVTDVQQDRDRDLREIRTRQGTQAKIKEGILRNQQDTNKTTPQRPNKENN